jgi:hypothetical protein
MYRQDVPMVSGVTDTLVITDIGVFLVEWDTQYLNFNHKLELSFLEIREVEAIVTERSIFPDSQQLRVTTSTNEQYHFMIMNGSVELARKLIATRLDH